MSIQIANLENEERKITASLGCLHVLEYARDCSVSPWNAADQYFMAKMGVRRRQIMAQLDGSVGVVTQAGAMQWTAGAVKATSGIKGAGDFLGKLVKGAVTKESAVKPEYVGSGAVALESNVPAEELIEVQLNGDELKIDGRMAICWSADLDFTVERVTRTLAGSAVSGEGFVNVYRGTGRVLMSPVAPSDSLFAATNSVGSKAADPSSNTFGQ